jgi:8-oxo-dGTP pyrophosphatase MutT (NUDIX family)
MEPNAAVAIVRTSGPDQCVLLMRRSEREGDSWSGHWSFPGGRREPDDVSPLETALRELEEECGVRLDATCLEGPLPPMTARRRGGVSPLVAPYVFCIDGEMPTELDPDEAVETVWAPLRVLADPSQHRLAAVAEYPPNVLFPSVPLGKVPLWGFTYRLIVEWLGLLPGAEEARQLTVEAVQWIRQFVEAEGRDVERVLEFLSASRTTVPPVSFVEVLPEKITVMGLGFESYVI